MITQSGFENILDTMERDYEKLDLLSFNNGCTSYHCKSVGILPESDPLVPEKRGEMICMPIHGNKTLEVLFDYQGKFLMSRIR